MYRAELKKLTNYVFGSTAAIITNVSLIVGLSSAGASKGPILGALLTIALADNISDSLAIHLYKEAEGSGTNLSILATTLNFSARLAVSMTFVAIALIYTAPQAIALSIVWGLLLIIIVSYLITRSNGQNSILEISKHVLVAVVVIAMSRQVGVLIARHFH